MFRLPVFCAAAALTAGTATVAQTYPSKPIRMVIPFAAGGPSDISARNISPRMTELLGVSLIIDNRGGASGFIGAEIVAKAPPDGYTMMLATASITSINMVVYPKRPYDTLRDFAPVTLATTSPNVIVVHASLPVHNVAQLVALARARPGQLNYGSASTGATTHLAAEIFRAAAKIELN